MFREVMLSALMAVLITFVFLALKRAYEVLKAYLTEQLAKAEKSNNESMTSMYSLAITVLDAVAASTVSRIEATHASVVRKAVKAGEKPYTELTQLSEEAYQEIVAQLSPKIKEALEACVGDTEKLIRNKIEEILPEIKQRYAYASVTGSLGEISPTEDMLKDGEQTEG